MLRSARVRALPLLQMPGLQLLRPVPATGAQQGVQVGKPTAASSEAAQPVAAAAAATAANGAHRPVCIWTNHRAARCRWEAAVVQLQERGGVMQPRDGAGQGWALALHLVSGDVQDHQVGPAVPSAATPAPSTAATQKEEATTPTAAAC
eukprot:230644-Prymnesium_polylepis.1